MKQAHLFWMVVSVLFLVLVAPVRAAESQVLHGHVPAAVLRLLPVGRLSSAARLKVAIGLPLRNQEALSALLQDIYDPASANYHRYLTPEQFTEMFGPTEQDYQAVVAFALTKGLTVTATHPNRVVLDVEGAVTDIEKAFNVTMRVYQHPREARTFHAPDVEPSLDLAIPILHISGLDDYSLPHPNLKLKPLTQTANATPNAGSGPGGAYRGNDFRAAYVPDTTLTGTGQSVGLLQFDGYYASDITTYENQAGLPNVTLVNVPIDGGVSTPGSGNSEVALDIEMVISMAPGVSKIYVYEAPNPSPWVDLLSRMANDNLAKQLSCSWGGGSPDATSEQIFKQMAAQGQSFFNATGDSDAFTGTIEFPSDSTNITQVGGTTLTTTGPGGSYVSETVWNWGYVASRNDYEGSSGGTSTYYPIPAYQQGISMSANLGSSTMRNVPDVALTGDNVYVVYNNGGAGTFGGTSCAAPLWAGFTALINQQAVAYGQPAAGFINPAIYAIGKVSSYANDFHDTTTGNNFSGSSPASFPAVPGYDLCTGWGTPAGQNLIDALAPLVDAPVIVISGSTLLAESCTPTNGAVDPGETVQVDFALRNIGGLNTTNLVATLLATNGVVAPSGAQTYGVLSTNGTIVSQPFTFTAGGAYGGTIIATLQLQDGTANLGNVSFNLPLGQFTAATTFIQNFDGAAAPALPAGWTTTATGAQSNWVTSSSAADTAPNAAFTTGANAVGVNELVSPPINVSSPTAQLSFRQNYNLQSSGSSGRDGGVLEIKIGADAFADILAAGGSFVSGGYIRAISTIHGNPLGGRQAWTGNSGGFITTVVNLPAAAAGQIVQLKWRCGTDNSTASVGWYVDTISIQDGYYTCCANTADLAIGQSVSPPLVNLNNNVTFTVNVTNLGPNTANNVVVTSTLPDGLTFVFAGASQGTWTVNNGVITCALATLNSGATATINIQATPTVAGSLTNTAVVSSATPDPATANNSASAAVSVNSPPTISDIPNAATGENGVAGPIAFTIGDAQTPASALALSAASSNTNLAPVANIVFGGGGSNRTVTITPVTNRFGTATITVTVSDGMAGTNASFILTVNGAPTLAPISNRTIAVGMTLVATNVPGDPDGDLLTFSLGSGAAANATINATNGVFSWSPTQEQIGTNAFSVIVTDSGLPPLSATQGFTVTVVPSNNPPVLAAVSNQTMAVGMTLTITNLASDPDGNQLTFSLNAGAATNANINTTNGVFTWTPNGGQIGTNDFTMVVTDNGLPPLSANQSFTVTVLPSNNPPVLAAISNQTIAVGMTLTITNVASDPDGDQLTFSLNAGAATNASINATNGVFTWTPNGDQIGTNTFTVEATDSGLPPLSATQGFTVTVVPSNNPPVLAAVSNQTIAVGMTLTITNVASDPDGDQLTFSLGAGAATNATINATNGVFTWTPTGDQIGTNDFTMVVTDNGLPPLSATQSFTVTVVPSNTAPVLAPIADRMIHAGSTLVITNSVTDTDSPPQVLAFSLDPGAPAAASINATNGVFTWTTGDADANTTNTIPVRVTDNGLPNLSDAKSFAVTVVPRPVLQSIAISNDVVTLVWSAIAGQGYRVQFETNVDDAAWSALAPDVTASGPTATNTDLTDGTAQRLYRVMVLP
jgi:uncharacterized repeat protein (TIGR01451 family)